MSFRVLLFCSSCFVYLFAGCMYNDWFIPKKFVIPVDHCGNHCACERDDGVVSLFLFKYMCLNGIMFTRTQTDKVIKEQQKATVLILTIYHISIKTLDRRTNIVHQLNKTHD